jgi:hypothetical protein
MRAGRYWLSAWMCVWVLALSTPSRAQAVFRVVAGRMQDQGDGVVAQAEGATIRLAKGAQLRLEPGTKLYRVHKQTRLWLDNRGRTLTHMIALASGKMDIESADADLAVMVSAPLASTSFVRGGRMHLAAQSDQVSIVNLDGSVSWAMKTWKFTRLEPGKVHTLARSGQTESAILPAPEVRLENNLFGGFGQGAALSGVSWQPLPGAQRYRVSIEQLEPERRLVSNVETTAVVLPSVSKLEPGRYALSVQAIDRFGINGRFSRAEAFSVMGVRSTDGGYVDAQGNIVAGYDRRVHLTYADGLLMKGGPHDWHPMPEEIVLPSGEPMNLHVRQAGDTRLVSARVLPQQVKTSVSVGPKFARWPGDSVRVEVKIEGPSAGIKPAWIVPRFRVLLGIDELEVAWNQSGDTYSTEVPPQKGEGPWIVRVEVEDQYGHLLGRDFVEVARRPAPLPPPPTAPAPPPAPAQASR